MTLKNSRIAWTLALALTSVAAPDALRMAQAAPINPCQKDVEKFCKDLPSGRGNISHCLKQHDAELSGGCKAQHEAFKKKLQATRDACLGDMNKFCKDTKGSRGGVMGCLSKHEPDLSTSCKSARATMRSRVHLRPATPPSS